MKKETGKPRYRWNGLAWILTDWRWICTKFPQRLK